MGDNGWSDNGKVTTGSVQLQVETMITAKEL